MADTTVNIASWSFTPPSAEHTKNAAKAPPANQIDVSAILTASRAMNTRNTMSQKSSVTITNTSFLLLYREYGGWAVSDE
jgi:hypothetical protein